MPKQDIPMNAGFDAQHDELGLETFGASLRDVFVDELGRINKRPTLDEWTDVDTNLPIDGLHWVPIEEKVLIVSGQRIFVAQDPDASVVTNVTGGGLPLNKSITTFADFTLPNSNTGSYIANGGRIIKLEFNDTPTTEYITDADAPTKVSHIAELDDFLLANDGNENQVFAWAKIGEPDSWRSSDFASAEAKFNKLQGVFASTTQLFLPTTRSLELWKNDGISPFVREFRGVIDNGLVAKHSMILVNETLFWMDNLKQIVSLTGGRLTVLSPSLNKFIASLNVVNDGIGNFIISGGRPYYLLSFITEGVTVVWDINSQKWYKWGTSVGGANYQAFGGKVSTYADNWGFTLVGDRSVGKVYKLNAKGSTDDGTVVRGLVRSGEYDHGLPNNRKKIKSITVTMKRDEVTRSTDKVYANLRWRDNGSANWEPARRIDLTNITRTTLIGTSHQCGAYYSRQYELVLDDESPTNFTKLQEDFEVLGD